MIKSGADINARDKDGSTILHLATQYSLGLVRFLIENGAQFGVKNNSGKTPLDLAPDNLVKEYLLELQKEDTNKEIVTNQDPCIICMGTRNGFFVLLPCAHASLCQPCCKKITKDKFGKCPTCRKPSKSYKKIFFQTSE